MASDRTRIKRVVWTVIGSGLLFGAWFEATHPQTTEGRVVPESQRTHTTRSPYCSADYLHCAPGDPEDTGRY